MFQPLGVSGRRITTSSKPVWAKRGDPVSQEKKEKIKKNKRKLKLNFCKSYSIERNGTPVTLLE